MSRVIVGTAGHIDHGKSSLVRALTGTDPDRLPEEKQRGITIDLGYAFLAGVAAIIDVPGHEKFIRNMVAGAATVDFALLVVAADDGVMPQTTEHLHILRLLGIQNGAIAITKIDKAESEWLDLVEEQVQSAVQRTFLDGAPVFRVDSLSGRGIAELRQYLLHTLASLPSRWDRGTLRLPIDRVFTVKGRGTVITGSMLSGSVRRDQRLVSLPGRHEVRVKHMESEGTDSEFLTAGQRAALNLVGDANLLERGQTLTQSEALVASTRIRVSIERLPQSQPLLDRQRIRFLVATQEVIGRLQLLGSTSGERVCANVLLEEPAVTVWGDHFVIRRYSPLETLGGGTVLEPDTPALRARDRGTELEFSSKLENTADVALASFLAYRGRHGLSLAHLSQQFGMTKTEVLKRLRASVSGLLEFEDVLFPPDLYDRLAHLVVDQLGSLHRRQPDSVGFAAAELRTGELQRLAEPLFMQIVDRMASDGHVSREGGVLHLPAKRIELTPTQSELVRQIRDVISTEGFTPSSSGTLSELLGRPRPDVERALVLMEKMGLSRRLGLDLFFEASAFDDAVSRVQALLETQREIGVSDVTQTLNSSRKYVVPLLEYLDSKGITQRQGNVRIAGRNFPRVDPA